MLDDGQAETGALGFAGTAFIDAVKTFGQARDMLCADAYTIILHGKLGAIRSVDPADLDVTVFWGVTDRIRHQIGQGAAYLIIAAADIRAGAFQRDLCLPADRACASCII